MKTIALVNPLISRPRLAMLGAVALTSLLAGCSDPSDKVAKTSGGTAQEAAKAPAAAKEYVVHADSKIGFVGSKVTGSHDGGFKKFDGKISVADGKVATAEIKIDMDSTWSDNEKLTGHLKSPDFFDTAKHPTSTFTVSSIADVDGKKEVTGNLDLHGVTKSIKFPAEISVADDAVTVKAEFAIKRQDFNIVYPGKPDDLIRDNVVIKLDLKATPGATQTAAK